MDFKKFYEEQSDYFEFRNNEDKNREYQMIIDWKKQHLCNCVPDNLKFSNILEVGCAFGALLNIVSKKLNITNSFGIDIASSNIEMAKKNFPDYKFYEGTLESLNIISILDAGRFDLVLLSDIVEHIPDDRTFLKTISRYADYVLLNLPLEKSFVTRNRNYGEDDPSGHLHCYGLNDALLLIEKSGFEVIEYSVQTAYSHPSYRRQFLRNEKNRLQGKPFFKRIILKSILKVLFSIGYFFPVIFKKYYGSNLFCLLKAKNE
jgi:SAM-dependent methyltransferase